MIGKLGFSLLLFLSLAFTVHAQKPPKKDKSNRSEKKTEVVKDEDEVLRVETSLITVPVSVSDKTGKFIPQLKRENFRIFEDGIEQEIEFFDPNESPFTVALLLDTSDSAESKFTDIQKSAAAFLDQLRPQDKVIVIGFNEQVYQLTEAISDRDELKKQIYRTKSGGGTSVYDSIEFISQKLRAVSGRKAIVLFSDGVDTTSRATYVGTLDLAKELDALIYTIRYETSEAARDKVVRSQPVQLIRVVTAKGEDFKVAYERATHYLTFLSENSGGQYFLADSPKNLTKVFERIASELRQQYSVGYYPKDEASNKRQRKIKVIVDVPNAVVKARKSYVYKNDSGENKK